METSICANCGKSYPVGETVRMGDSVVCFSCVERAYLDHRDAADKLRMARRIQKRGRLTPSVIKDYLDQYIIGQEYAKKMISLAVYNHYKRLSVNKQIAKGEGNGYTELEKTNIIMCGRTGSGKTAIFRAIANFLKVPFATFDMSSVSGSGYIGADCEGCIQRLLQAADGDVAAAEQGIVFLDEIDKKSRKGENPSISRDVSGESVQQEILKIIEGTIVNVPARGQRMTPGATVTQVNTKDVLFVLAGAFEGIEQIIAKRQHKHHGTIGFGSELQDKDCSDYNKYILDLRTEDLRKFGMIPELLGRVPLICPFLELSKDEYIRILNEPKNALLKQYRTMLRVDGSDLEVTDAGYDLIVKKAAERKTGARALRAILEETLGLSMFSIPDEKDPGILIIDAEGDKLVVKTRQEFSGT